MPATAPKSQATSTAVTPMDRKSFSILIREHHPSLMVYARSLVSDESTAADLVQDAFVAAWQNLGKFDVTRDFATWMRGIVRNKWRDHCRRVSRRAEVADDQLQLLEQTLASWEEERIRSGNGIFDRLENCLKKLPETLRDATKAFYYEGHSGEETAESLGVNPATVRKRLERARQNLKTCLEA